MNTSIVSENDGLEKACAWIQQGIPVALPTETVYGLAANALDSAAVLKIFATKERPHFDPLIVHLPTPGDWNTIVDTTRFSPNQKKWAAVLAKKYWPGPLTLVLPKHPDISDLVTSGLDTVAVRSPRHPLFQKVLQNCGLPLAAPSANRFGRISPTSAQDVLAELNGRIPLILDGGRCSIGVESTILAWDIHDRPVILRPGQITQKELEEFLGSSVLLETASSALQPQAPGMLASHYSPRTPFFILEKDWEFYANRFSNLGYIAWQGGFPLPLKGKLSPLNFVALSQAGDWAEIGQNLFFSMRLIDNQLNPLTDAILIEKMPENASSGLALAIFDRISRALSEKQS